MKLLKIGISTNEEVGANFFIREMEMKETDNSFMGEGNRIAKDKILIVDTMMHNNPPDLYFFTYCLPEEKEGAISLLMNAVNNRYNTIKENFEILKRAVEIMNKSNLANYLNNAKIVTKE